MVYMAEEKKYTKKELEKMLTTKQKIFCHEYIIDWNAARSAKAAGYSGKTAKEIGCENLTKPNIQRYLDIIKDDVAKEAGISKLSLILELKKIAYSSIARLHNNWITRKEFEELKEANPDILDAIQEIDTKIHRTQDKDGNDINVVTEYVKIKFYDKQKAIQDIMKAMGWNEPEKVDVTTQGEKVTQIYKIGDQIIEF